MGSGRGPSVGAFFTSARVPVYRLADLVAAYAPTPMAAIPVPGLEDGP